MSNPLSSEILDIIERRCAAATPGPWMPIAESRNLQGRAGYIRTSHKDMHITDATAADQDFIAHARQDVPLLIQEIRALRGALSAQLNSL